MANRGPGGAVFGIALVVLAAVALHFVWHCRSVAKGILYLVLGLLFLSGSSWNAIKNISASGEDSREVVSSHNEQFQRAREDRIRWSQARKAQFAVAGDATIESIDAEIHAKQVEPGSRWNATEGCKAEKVTAGPSRTYCVEIDRLRVKLAAARSREELDAKIAALDASDKGQAVQKTVDAGSERIADALRAFGYKIEGEKGVAIAGEWFQAVLQELVAGFGPGLHFAFFMLILSGSRPKSPMVAAEKPAAKPVKIKAAIPVAEPEIAPPRPSVAVLEADAEIDAFVASSLEFDQGEIIKPTPLFEAWKEFCAEHGIAPGGQKGFCNRIKRRVKHHSSEETKNRPYYSGVKLKAKGAPAKLKIVKRA